MGTVSDPDPRLRFACQAMTPVFAEILLEAGAKRTAGFTKSPEHSELYGRQRFGAFDVNVIKALHRAGISEDRPLRPADISGKSEAWGDRIVSKIETKLFIGC